MTLRELIEENPEWLDYDIVVYREDGEYDYVGASGMVYLDKSEKQPVIVFAGN